MPKQYRVGAFVRFNNAVMKAMLRAGVRMGSFAILTVRGRKERATDSNPARRVSQGRESLPYCRVRRGELGAQPSRSRRGGRPHPRPAHREDCRDRVVTEQGAPIFRESLRAGAPGIPKPIVSAYRRFFVLPYLDVDMNSSQEEFERAVLRHPVFLIKTVA